MRQKRRVKNDGYQRWRWQGSYTLEAVFVIPLILGIIYAWMFELFYFHDQVILQGVMQENLIKKVGNMQNRSTIQIQEELERKLWLLEIASLKEKESVGVCRYQLKAKALWKIPVMKDFLKSALNIRKEWRCYTVQPDFLCRMQE